MVLLMKIKCFYLFCVFLFCYENALLYRGCLCWWTSPSPCRRFDTIWIKFGKCFWWKRKGASKKIHQCFLYRKWIIYICICTLRSSSGRVELKIIFEICRLIYFAWDLKMILWMGGPLCEAVGEECSFLKS